MAKNRPQQKPKDHDAVIKYAVAHGSWIETRKSGHIRIHLPNGNMQTASATSSDVNAGRALLRNLIHKGMEIDW